MGVKSLLMLNSWKLREGEKFFMATNASFKFNDVLKAENDLMS